MAKKEIDGIGVNGKSIIAALKIIQQVCKDNDGGCINCPFCIESPNGTIDVGLVI